MAIKTEVKELQVENKELVVHPEHYNKKSKETKDIIKDIVEDKSGYEAWLVGTIVKYLDRYKYKGDPKTDLDKVIFYTEELKKEVE